MTPVFRGGFSKRGKQVTSATTVPTYNPGQHTLVYAGDSSDSHYNSVAACVDTQPLTLRMSTTGVSPGVLDIVTGRGGVGKALQVSLLPNAGPGQVGGSWHQSGAPAIAAGKEHFWRMPVKFDGDMSNLPIGVTFAIKFCKFINLNAFGANTPQWSTHNNSPCANVDPSQFTWWQYIDESYNDDVSAYPNGHDQGVQPTGPYHNSLLNTGLYYPLTYQYKPPTSVGGSNGIARLWLGSTLLVNVSSTSDAYANSGLGNSPPGGFKQYCGIDILTHMASGAGTAIGGPQFDQGPSFGGIVSEPVPSDFTVTYTYNLGDADPTNPYTYAWWYTT